MLNPMKLITRAAVMSLIVVLMGCGQQQLVSEVVKEVAKEVKEGNLTKNARAAAADRQVFSKQPIVLAPETPEELPLFTLSKEVSEGLTKELGFRFAEIGFVDSRNGTRIHMLQEGSTLEFSPSDAEFRRITPVVVTGAPDVMKGLRNCNFISFDLRTELICEKGPDQAPLPSGEVPDIPAGLAADLETVLQQIAVKYGAGDDFKIGFVLAFDVVTGDGKLLKNPDYIQHPKLPRTLPAMTNDYTNVWSFITQKVNPCCKDVFINGSWQRICDKSVPACP